MRRREFIAVIGVALANTVQAPRGETHVLRLPTP